MLARRLGVQVAQSLVPGGERRSRGLVLWNILGHVKPSFPPGDLLREGDIRIMGGSLVADLESHSAARKNGAAPTDGLELAMEEL